MRLETKIDKVVSTGFCESFKELPQELVDKLWDYYESLSESKSFNLDETLDKLKELGNMELKRWTLSSEMIYVYNRPEHYLELFIEFDNGFYCCFNHIMK